MLFPRNAEQYYCAVFQEEKSPISLELFTQQRYLSETEVK